MRLTATRSFRYKGRQLKAGDGFEASTADGKAFKAVRYANDAPAEVSKPAPKHPPAEHPKQHADTHAEPQTTENSEPIVPPEKPAVTRYPTRRLKAED